MSGIFVGVDGSGHSRDALGWAIREAVQHHMPLTVVTVRPSSVRPATEIYWPMPILPEEGGDLELARMAVRQWVDKVANEIGERVPEVTVNVVTGDPAEELIKASYDADMIVVGSRGSGGFAELMLGSVSSKVAHHAACVVVVVRRTR